MATTISMFGLFALALAHGHGNAHARLHTRQTSTTAPVCQDQGVHMIVGSGAGAPQIDGYGLLESVVDDIKQAIPGSTSYSVPFNKTTDPLYAAAASAQGVVLMTENVKWYADGCPNTPIVLLGYSQGGIIVMNTLCGRSTSTPWGTPLDSSYAANIMMTVTYGEETRQPNQPYNYGTCTSGTGILARQNLAGCDAFAPNIRSYCELNDPRCCVGSPAPNNDTHYVYPTVYDTDVTSAVLAKYNAWKTATAPSTTTDIPDVATSTFLVSSVILPSSTETPHDVDSGVTSKIALPESSADPTTFPIMYPYTNTSTIDVGVPTTTQEPVPTTTDDCTTTEEQPTPTTTESPETPTTVTEQHTVVTTEDCTTETAPPAGSTPSAPPPPPESSAPVSDVPPTDSTPSAPPPPEGSVPASSVPDTPSTSTSTSTTTSTRTLTSRLTITRTRAASTATLIPAPSNPASSEPVVSSTPSAVPSSPTISPPPYQTSLTPYNPNAASRTQGAMAWSSGAVVVLAYFVQFLF